MLSMHALAAVAFIPSLFSWSGVLIGVVMFWIAGGLGVCLGYHRLLTHGSFKTRPSIRFMLSTLGTLSYQGSPLQWVGTHRIHHRHSDAESDPHSPEHGFTWSHVLWCFFRHPDGLDPMDYVRDLRRDRSMMRLDRFFYVPQIVLAVALFGLGWWFAGTWQVGLGWVAWGVGVRAVLMYHATWFVNSAAHTWGYRNFQTTDGSRNNWWVALVSFGEGWHNNHHAQQRSAAHGMKWWEVDPTWWTILVMERMGLVWQVVRPNRNYSDTKQADDAS
jgi:stearoyl-CoA desaturase (delta-9 desaturase)